MSRNIISRYDRMFYKKYGYLILRNKLDDKMKIELKHLTNNIERDSLRLKPVFQHKFEFNKIGNKKLCRTEDLLINDDIKSILTTGLLPNIISNVFESPVLLFKEKINYKYPNTGEYRAHQDITAYPNSANHITALINLCDTDKTNGSIQFSPLCNNGLSNNVILENTNGIITNSEKLNWNECIQSKFGDIILFNSYIPHKSAINVKKFPRKALYLTYNNAYEGDKRKEYYDLKNKHLKSDKISLIDHYDGSIMTNQMLYQKEYIIDYIINLYLEHGHTKYDKDGSQLDHAFAVMNIAKENNYSKKFQLSCFLHDIGHLLLDEHNSNKNFLMNDLRHEYHGAKFLKQFLSNEIISPITLHVKAKRYLCTIDENYYNNLSEASKQSFKIQGGKMNDREIKIFKNNKYFKEAIRMREFEDISKKNMPNTDSGWPIYVRKLLNCYVFNYKYGFRL